MKFENWQFSGLLLFYSSRESNAENIYNNSVKWKEKYKREREREAKYLSIMNKRMVEMKSHKGKGDLPPPALSRSSRRRRSRRCKKNSRSRSEVSLVGPVIPERCEARWPCGISVAAAAETVRTKRRLEAAICAHITCTAPCGQARKVIRITAREK